MTDKEKIKAIIKQYIDKGERLYNESCETKEDSQTISYWDGYKDCANLLLRELEDMQEVCMYSKDNYTDEDRKVLCDGCEEECKFNKKEEPVSEELAKAAKENAKIERSDDTEVGYDINRFGGFVDGANWQLKKAINWLKSNINCDMWIKDFVKNMEE